MAWRSSPHTMSPSNFRSLSVSWMNSCASGSVTGLPAAVRTMESKPTGSHVLPSTAARTAADRAGGAGPAPQIPDGTCHPSRWGRTYPHGELPDARGLRCADRLRVHRGVQHPDLVGDHVR